jgi:hypothetical protein
MRNSALATVAFISLLVMLWLALDQQITALLWLILDIGWLLAALFLWNKTGPIDKPRLKRRLSRLLFFSS